MLSPTILFVVLYLCHFCTAVTFVSVFHFTVTYSIMFRVCFPVYCHVLCEICQHLSVDPMIIQPILEELKSSLDRCFSAEVAGLPLVQKETENLEILRSTVHSLERSKYIPSLGFDGKTFQESCSNAGVSFL